MEEHKRSNHFGEPLTEYEILFMAKNSKCPDCEEGHIYTKNPNDVDVAANIMIKVHCSNKQCAAVFSISKDLNQGMAQRVSERKLSVATDPEDIGDYEEFECGVCVGGMVGPAKLGWDIELKCDNRKCNMSYV